MSLTIAAHQAALHTWTKNKIREAQPTAASSEIAPKATKRTSFTSETAAIPDPKLFEGLKQDFVGAPDGAPSHSSLKTGDKSVKGVPGDTELPTIAECAVHLELLLCFSTFHQTVERSRSLGRAFTIFPRPKIVQRRRGPHKIKDSTFDTRSRQKWPTVLNIAVKRFLVWVRAIDGWLATTGREKWAEAFPPPLDVLFVWHAALLNPSYYIQFCESNNLAHIIQVAFPWSKIHAAIDSKSYAFSPPEAVARHFSTLTDLEPHLIESILRHSVSQPIALKLARLIEPSIPTKEVFESEHVTSRELLPGGREFLNFFDKSKESRTTIKELSDAVTRQFIFCTKMENQLWVRSPAALGTLTRACLRYQRFLKLFKLYPRTMLVPTLDIDLCWHTHQLSHQRYLVGMEFWAGRYIDHDDRLGKPTLNSGMERTEQLFIARFGVQYAACNCWECEALTSALEVADLGGDEDTVDLQALATKMSSIVESYRQAERIRRSAKPAVV